MAEPGTMNTLTVIRQVDIGLYLDGENLGRILLPRQDLRRQCPTDLRVAVFVHYDQEGRFIATTRRPAALPGSFAYLKAVKSSSAGTLLDWGLRHFLLAPLQEQRHPMEAGKSYLVRIVHDPAGKRIFATSRIDQFLDQTPPDYQANQQVSLLIGAQTDLGYKAIVNDAHWGVLYANEVFHPLKKGDRLPGYIKKIRDDHKIDLFLHPPGYDKVDGLAERILALLTNQGGFLAANDKTPPETIHQWFGVSKKTFKKAIGLLYKQKRITLSDEGIRLCASP